LDDAAALFGESASRIVLSVAGDNVARVMEQAATAGVPAKVLGRTGGQRLRISTGGRTTVDLPVEDGERAWSAAIDSYFEKKIA
jgi:phosphoribosylformylglycinamidine synthase